MGNTPTITDWLTAAGTIAVAILAIWGDWFRHIFAPRKLKLVLRDPKGDLTNFSVPGIVVTGPTRIYYYHLVAINERRWLTPKNCRVVLKAVHKRGPDGHFHQLALAIPLLYVWAPAEFTPPVITIEDEAPLDFGSLPEAGSRFAPRFYGTPNNFEGTVAKDEVLRYSLQVVADGFVSKQYQVFEVAWNGNWDADREKMSRNLVIREILSN